MSIYDEVLDYIHAPAQACFEALALKVFRYQFASIPLYRNYCVARDADPDQVKSLDKVPALSTAAFKYAQLINPVTFPAPAEARVFMTSGTTAGRADRGCHRVPRLDIYRASALRHARRMLFPDSLRTRMLSLHPGSQQMPESSLALMITWIIEEFGAGEPAYAADRKGVDIGLALQFLREAENSGEPVCLMGTTAAFAAMFDEIGNQTSRLSLASGSRLMDTGGAKGQKIPLRPGEIVERARVLLGIAPSMTINEYGMTELCSQLYDATQFNSTRPDPPGERWKESPAWLSAAAVDPISLERLPDGTPGLLRFFDLANVGSISAILTGDLGVVQERKVKVLGRAEDGEARGCALGLEQFATREV